MLTSAIESFQNPTKACTLGRQTGALGAGVRRPRVHYFNPGCELEIAGAGPRARRAAQQMRVELDHLSMFICDPDDHVLVEELPSDEFLERLRDTGFTVPSFIKLAATGDAPTLDLAALESLPTVLDRAEPWGWSPPMLRLFEPLRARLSDTQGLRAWSAERTRIHSKGWAAHLLRSFLDSPLSTPWRSYLCATDQVAKSCRDSAELGVAVDALHRSDKRAVLKGLYGTSGRDMARTLGGKLEANTLRWAEKLIDRDGEILVEQWHRSKADLSLRMNVHPNGSHTVQGIGRFLTDRRGQYRGGLLGDIGPDLQLPCTRGQMESLFFTLAEFLAAALHHEGYAGRVGVDALVMDSRIHPMLEINPRNNMGHVVEAMSERLAPGSIGAWFLGRSLHSRSANDHAREAGPIRSGEPMWLEALQSRLPVERDPRSGRIRSGAIATSPPSRRVQSMLLVAPTWHDLITVMDAAGLQHGLIES